MGKRQQAQSQPPFPQRSPLRKEKRAPPKRELGPGFSFLSPYVSPGATSQTMPPTRPSPPASGLSTALDAGFLAHVDELRARLADERTSMDAIHAKVQAIEAQATMALHKRQGGDEPGALADASDAALALWQLLRRGSAVPALHRAAISPAATAVATVPTAAECALEPRVGEFARKRVEARVVVTVWVAPNDVNGRVA